MSSPTTLPRLDGEALYSWAILITQEQALKQAKQQLAIRLLQERGYTPGEHLLSNDGYIVTRDQARLGTPDVVPDSPDNAS